MILKTTNLNPGFQRKNLFGKKYASGPEILAKRDEIFDILLEKINLDSILPISQDSQDFYVEILGSSRSF